MVLGTPEESGTVDSGERVRAAKSIGAAGTAAGGGLRAGGGGAVLAGDGTTPCESLGGGGGGALSGIATFGLIGDTGSEGFRMGTAGFG